jgi:malate dehydrogenase
MGRVTIVGSGNVGANTAFFIAEKGVADVTLYDINEGMSSGKALDMMEAAPIRNYRTKMKGSDSIDCIEGSDVIVVAAGSVRKPKMRREDLFGDNASIVIELARRIKQFAPQSKVVVVTEPVDLLTTVFTVESGFPREKVLGLGGILDSTRLNYSIARDLGISTENVSALVIGRHDKDMIALPAYTTVSGVPVLQLMHADRFESLVHETKGAGDFIVDMAKKASAYYAPSASAAELVDSICRDCNRVLSVSVLLMGEYGIEGVALSIPAVVGKDGVKKILLPKLEEEELSQFRTSAEEMKKKIGRNK